MRRRSWAPSGSAGSTAWPAAHGCWFDTATATDLLGGDGYAEIIVDAREGVTAETLRQQVGAVVGRDATVLAATPAAQRDAAAAAVRPPRSGGSSPAWQPSRSSSGRCWSRPVSWEDWALPGEPSSVRWRAL
jgi:hypothetical protein